MLRGKEIHIINKTYGLFNYLTFSHTLRFLSALLILVIWAWGIRILEKQDGRVGKPSHPGG
jgi:hypothetical protein